MGLSVKELAQEDIPFIYRVFKQNRAVLHGNYISLEEWREYLGAGADPHEVHFIIMSQDSPAAWLKLNSLQKREICVSMLVVDDAFKRRGVGRFALEVTELYAKDRQKTAILIQTTKDNTAAVECYLKCGYGIHREMIYQVGDGLDREGVEFRKELALVF